MEKSKYFFKILFGLFRLTAFWIVANMHIVLSSLLDSDTYPALSSLKNGLRIGGPVIFGILWMFFEGEFLEDCSWINNVDKWMKEKIGVDWIYKGIKFIIKLIAVLLVISLIMACFYIYDKFIGHD